MLIIFLAELWEFLGLLLLPETSLVGFVILSSLFSQRNFIDATHIKHGRDDSQTEGDEAKDSELVFGDFDHEENDKGQAEYHDVGSVCESVPVVNHPVSLLV